MRWRRRGSGCNHARAVRRVIGNLGGRGEIPHRSAHRDALPAMGANELFLPSFAPIRLPKLSGSRLQCAAGGGRRNSPRTGAPNIARHESSPRRNCPADSADNTGEIRAGNGSRITSTIAKMENYRRRKPRLHPWNPRHPRSKKSHVKWLTATPDNAGYKSSSPPA